MRDSEKIIRKLSSGSTKSFAELALERGYITATQIEEAKRKQKAFEAKGVQKDLGDILVEQGLVSPEQARAIGRALRGATVIAGFEILEKVGQGGMGAVFRARQIGMDRVVALKILPPKLAADAGFKERFLREARLSAKLNHLNIINGIDCGEEAGYTYFAMEFVEGTTARQIVKKKGKVNLEDCYSIIKQIGDALDYANKHGLVHRDIKPENIMVTPQGIAKLCDLGLAKQSENTEDASLTQSGQAVGTPHYISPEQARGEKDVDIRSDIYSLGATLYHMLTGQTPFDGSTAASIMAKHLTEEARSVCDVDGDVPEAWGAIVAKMMAKEPRDRYDSPKDLNEDLEAAYNGGVVQALSFRGKTSCAMPRKGGRRIVPPTQPVSKTVKADVRKGTTGHLAPISVGDRTTRHVTAVGSRQENVPSGLLIGLGVAVVALVAFLMMPRDSAPPIRPSPPRTVVQNDPPVRSVYEPKVAEKPSEKSGARKTDHAEPVREEPAERPPVEIAVEPGGRKLWYVDFEDGSAGKFSPDPGKVEVARLNGRTALKATNDKWRIGANHPVLAPQTGLFLECDLLSSGLKSITVSYRVKGPEGFGRYNEVVQPESQDHWVHIRSSLSRAQKVEGPWNKPDGLSVQHVEIFGLKVSDQSTTDYLALDNVGMYEGEPEAPTVVQLPTPPPQREPPKPVEKPAVPAANAAEADAAYGAFLSEMVAKAAPAELAKALTELKKSSSNAAYKPAKKDIEAELAAVETAVQFEADALERLGKKKGAEVIVAQNAMKKTFNNDRGKVSGLDPVRGLDVNVKGGGVWLLAHEIDPISLAESGVGLNGPAMVEYLILRNRLNDAETKAATLPAKDKDLADRKIALLRKYQKEEEAKQAFAALKELEQAKKWAQLADEAAAFEANHKGSEFGKQQAAMAVAMQKEAQDALKTEKPVAVQANAAPMAVLFICRPRDNGEIGDGDRAVKERLEKLNATVTVKDQDQVNPSDADGKAMVLISSTVSARRLNSRFRDVRVPVIVWEIGVFRDMGLAYRDGRDDASRVQIVKNESPLAAGLNGVQEVQNGGTLSWGSPGNAANVIAHVDGQRDHAVLFTYEQGANLIDGKAAQGKRAVIFFFDDSPAGVNDNGWKMFDATVRWAAGDAAKAPAPAPKPNEKPEPGKLFKTKSVQKADGSVEAIWTPADAQAFADDWQLDDPRQRNQGEKFMQVGTVPDVLMTLKGVSGEMWDGERRNAPFVVLSNAKPEKFRLEVAYGVPRHLKDRDAWTAGLGLWNGQRSGIIFGARRIKDGPLAIWGALNGQNVDEKNLPRNSMNITMERGQLAIISDGKDWTFYYREANEMAPESWRRIHTMPAAKGHFPALTAFSWDEQAAEIYYYAVRLTIPGDDPSLKGK